MELQFEKDLQAAVDEGEKKKLAKENKALRAKDEKLIDNLRRKVGEYNFDLNKSESELTRARKQLAENNFDLLYRVNSISKILL